MKVTCIYEKNNHFTYVVHINLSQFHVKKKYINIYYILVPCYGIFTLITVVFLTIRVVKVVTTSTCITARPVVSNSDHLIIVGWTHLPNTSLFAKGNRKHGRRRPRTL